MHQYHISAVCILLVARVVIEYKMACNHREDYAMHIAW